jgi:hypothetical protein
MIGRFLDSIVAQLSPTAGLKRAQARAILARSYAGCRTKPTRRQSSSAEQTSRPRDDGASRSRQAASMGQNFGSR